jgi:hypothetical protein
MRVSRFNAQLATTLQYLSRSPNPSFYQGWRQLLPEKTSWL